MMTMRKRVTAAAAGSVLRRHASSMTLQQWTATKRRKRQT
jgi:hypothetical protein